MYEQKNHKQKILLLCMKSEGNTCSYGGDEMLAWSWTLTDFYTGWSHTCCSDRLGSFCLNVRFRVFHRYIWWRRRQSKICWLDQYLTLIYFLIAPPTMIRIFRTFTFIVLIGAILRWICLTTDICDRISQIIISPQSITMTWAVTWVDLTGAIPLSATIVTGSTSLTGTANELPLISSVVIADLPPVFTGINTTGGVALGANTGNVSPLTIVTGDIVTKNATSIGKFCQTPRWETITHNQYIVAYIRTKSATCDRQKRYCSDGVLQGDYQYNYCLFDFASISAVLSWDSNNLTSSTTWSLWATSASWVATTNELTDTPSSADASLFDLSWNANISWNKTQNTAKNSIIDTTTKNTTGSSMKLWSGSTSSSSLWEKEWDLTNPAKLTKTPAAATGKQFVYDSSASSLTVKTNNTSGLKSCTTPRSTQISHGVSILAYEKTSAAPGTSCQYETRYCSDGKLSGKYTQEKCMIPASNYKERSNPYETTTQTEFQQSTKTTTSWKNWISQTQSISQSLNHRSLLTSTPAVASSTNTNNANGNTSNNSINSANNGSYSWNGTARWNRSNCMTTQRWPMYEGSHVIGYESEEVPFGGSCKSEYRICKSGTLWGSYQYTYCRVTPPANCNDPSLGPVSHGSYVMAAQAESVGSWQVCNYQYRYCNNGILNGTYTKRSCFKEY